MQTPRRRPRLWLVALLASVLAGGLITLGLVAPKLIDQLGEDSADPAASPSSNGAPGEIQIECAAVRHEYSAWKRSDANLARVPSITARDVFKFEMEQMLEAGKAFLKASSGYRDQPSKALATAIAEHNFDVSTLNLEGTLSGTVKPETYEKVKKSRQGVETGYETFLVLTCA